MRKQKIVGGSGSYSVDDICLIFLKRYNNIYRTIQYIYYVEIHNIFYCYKYTM